MDYKKLLWVPLDLPPIEKEITLANIQNFYNYVPTVTEDERTQYAKQKQHYKYAWNTFRLRSAAQDSVSWENQNLTKEWSWTEDAITHCPKLVSYIDKYLPFKQLKAASIMSSNGSVPAHLDMPLTAAYDEKKNYLEHEPSVYRLLIDGSIHDNSFYVATVSAGKKYITMPLESPGWAMGCYSCAHGNDEKVPNQKLLVYLMGDLDTEKHNALIEASYNKYKDLAIVSTELI
jgi:hypothetical protein